MRDRYASVKMAPFALVILLVFAGIQKCSSQTDSTYKSIIERMDSLERKFDIAKINIQASGEDFKKGTSFIISGTAAAILGGILTGISYQIKDYEKQNLVRLTGFSFLGVGTVLNISGLGFCLRGSKRLSGRKSVPVNL